MARTTLNIDTPVLNELRRMQREQKRPLGEIVSELLAHSLAAKNEDRPKKDLFRWRSQRMGIRIDLADKEAIYAVLDEPYSKRKR